MTDYSSKSDKELTDIYWECKLDDRFVWIGQTASAQFEPGSRDWLVYVAVECDKRGLI